MRETSLLPLLLCTVATLCRGDSYRPYNEHSDSGRETVYFPGGPRRSYYRPKTYQTYDRRETVYVPGTKHSEHRDDYDPPSYSQSDEPYHRRHSSLVRSKSPVYIDYKSSSYSSPSTRPKSSSYSGSYSKSRSSYVSEYTKPTRYTEESSSDHFRRKSSSGRYSRPAYASRERYDDGNDRQHDRSGRDSSRIYGLAPPSRYSTHKYDSSKTRSYSRTHGK